MRTSRDQPEREFTVRHDLAPDEIAALEERIHSDDAAQTGHRDKAQLGFVLNAGGEMVGAVTGYSWGGTCHLRQLWVADRHRRRGHGRALVEKAVAEARARQCARIYLAVHEFQLSRFYAALGFKPVAALEDSPKGHLALIMCLKLPAAAG